MEICQFCKFQIELRRGVWSSHEGSYCDDNRGNYCHSPESGALHESVARVENVCRACNGKGTEADYVGLEMRCVETECSSCGGTGKALSDVAFAISKAQPEPERGTAREEIKQKADNAYCNYIEQMKRPDCLGFDAKVKSGEFSKTNLEAFTRAYTEYGKHIGLHEAMSIIDRAPSPLPVREQSVEWGAIEALAVEELCCDGSGECNVCKAIKAAKEMLKLRPVIAGEKEE